MPKFRYRYFGSKDIVWTRYDWIWKRSRLMFSIKYQETKDQQVQQRQLGL